MVLDLLQRPFDLVLEKDPSTKGSNGGTQGKLRDSNQGVRGTGISATSEMSYATMMKLRMIERWETDLAYPCCGSGVFFWGIASLALVMSQHFQDVELNIVKLDACQAL